MSNTDGEEIQEMGFINGHPDRNYEEDFEHENGNYISRCRECQLYFRGHKRRFICKQCLNSPPDWLKLSQKQPPKEIKNNAWPGCWADGEMTGFARCMVKKVQPLEKELASLREQLAGAEQQIKSLNEIIENLMNDEKDDMINLREQLAKKDEDAIQAIDALTKQIAELMHQLKQKEDENRELKDDYKDLVNSIQRLFQTLIARQYNNIGVWSNERQDYNHQLINELEELLKTHNTRKNLSA